MATSSSRLLAQPSCFVLVGLLFGCAGPREAQAPTPAPTEPGRAEVRDTSYRATDGSRVVRLESWVPTSVDEVWQAFTTTGGLRAWTSPASRVELRIGGIWEAGQGQGAPGMTPTVRQEILSYLPGEMLSLRLVSAPPGTPNAALAKEVWTVVQLEPAGHGTRVTLSILGWGEGVAWESVRKVYTQVNTTSLQQLRRRFADGR